jgi:hypothetical protein
MMVTASKIPVPLPMAPKKSAIMERAPIQRPPKAAADWDISLQFLFERSISVSSHGHLLFSQLLSNISSTASGNFGPSL